MRLLDERKGRRARRVGYVVAPEPLLETRHRAVGKLARWHHQLHHELADAVVAYETDEASGRRIALNGVRFALTDVW